MSPTHIPPSVVELLAQTGEDLEIWWDSSPLIFDRWRHTVVEGVKDEKQRAALSVQLSRLYNHEAPAESVFVGCTTNPPLSLEVLSHKPKGGPRLWDAQWTAWIDDLIRQHPHASRYELFWKTYMEVVGRGAAMFRSKFEATGYRRGYLSGQVEPRLLQDTEAMVAQGMALNAAHPNVMIKMPGTKEGIAGIRILASKGIPTNATLVFTIPQILAVAEAVQAGHAEAVAKGVDTSRWRAVCTMMLGRYEDVPEFAAQCAAQGFELSEADKRWAGIAIFKKACRLFKERAYPLKMLAASMRLGPVVDGRMRVWHIEKLAGHEVVLTIFPNIYEAWLTHYTPDEVVSHADEEVPEKVLERLLKVDYFRQGYMEDGLSPDEFITHPAVVATGNSFAEATRELELYVGQRMKVVRG